jgi:long-chain fatty acid transport protein
LRIFLTAALGGLAASAASGAAHAGGFGLEQSAYYQGVSFAGAAAGGESLAAISWNPAAAMFAGSGLLSEVSVSGVLLDANVTVDNPGAQLPPPGIAETNIGRNALIGASYTTWRMNEKTVLALSLTSPFGLGTKPDQTDWAGQYEGITTFIFNLNATPMISYEVAPGLSLGAGVQIDYFGLKRQTAQTPLGLANFKADDFGVGFVAGVTYAPTPGTSIGIGYRSMIEHTAEGHVEIDNLGQAPAQAKLQLPDMVALGVRQSITPTTRLLGEAEWVGWSRLGVVPVVLTGNFAGIAPSGATVANFDFRWRDGWLFSLGGEYDWSPSMTLRTGVAYEISPVDGPTTRLVQDPDSDRIWASLGGSYRLGDGTRLDFSYSHVFFENDAPFNRVTGSTLFTTPPLIGSADLSMDLLSIGMKVDLGNFLQ